jgi:ABC-type transport system involved in Fe-S cluster assembly fused permease/ATPase subunit
MASVAPRAAPAEAANARGFIEQLPEKFDTKVGEGGIQLSGASGWGGRATRRGEKEL